MNPEQIMNFIDENQIPMIEFPSPQVLSKVVKCMYEGVDFEPTTDYELFYRIWSLVWLDKRSPDIRRSLLEQYLDKIPQTDNVNFLILQATVYSYMAQGPYNSSTHPKYNEKENEAVLKLSLMGKSEYLEAIHNRIQDFSDEVPKKIAENFTEMFAVEQNRPIITKLIYEYTRFNPVALEYKNILKQVKLEWCEDTSPLFIEYVKLLQR